MGLERWGDRNGWWRRQMLQPLSHGTQHTVCHTPPSVWHLSKGSDCHAEAALVLQGTCLFRLRV
jgi:hypothetical protein